MGESDRWVERWMEQIDGYGLIDGQKDMEMNGLIDGQKGMEMNGLIDGWEYNRYMDRQLDT